MVILRCLLDPVLYHCPWCNVSAVMISTVFLIQSERIDSIPLNEEYADRRFFSPNIKVMTAVLTFPRTNNQIWLWFFFLIFFCRQGHDIFNDNVNDGTRV